MCPIDEPAGEARLARQTINAVDQTAREAAKTGHPGPFVRYTINPGDTCAAATPDRTCRRI
jgi:hypothetical protein